ncbi:AMP-binding protein [Haloechinothrix sp. LS1_15]|uniref:AMP-binding protein n=1 Tax=Haloechinothrix sp. LS1_15 TaxID=2652248 RepID=UPI002945747B|nr:AMP-binding protein [Haloechinothrix sp. LS1_15]MDV6012088.1 long-chain fatty acid--CoA ligase [Haloechinothrix sp. LS1_15]
MTARTDRQPAPAAASDGTTADTFPRLLRALAGERPDSVAMQEKLYGIWQPITWSEYAERVADFAHGLAELGVERGEVVAVIGDNRPEWLIAELATQSIGAAVVGIYPTSIGEEIVHILSDARVRVVIAEDQEQVDKIIRLKDDVSNVHTVVYYDPHGLEQYRQPYLRAFTEIEESGRAWGARHPGWLDERVTTGSAADIAVICTTSGTTSRPKLAELSHRNLLAMSEHLQQVDPLTPRDRYVSFLPFAWIGEQMIAVACGLSEGFTISFPEDSSTQRANLREIGPDVMFSPPRIWESMLSDVQVRIGESDRLKRSVFAWGYRVGDRYAEHRVRGARPGLWLRLTHRLADAVALRPVRDHLGLTRLKRGYTGGAPLGPDVFRFFHAIGVNLKQIYGQTEICGIAVTHTDTDVRFHTVGTPLPGTELRIAEDGEILLRSASVFRGYHRNPEATSETVDGHGWLHTGDAGYLDDGHLVVIDRAKDVRRTADGQLFSTAFVENKVKFSQFVEEAVMFGGESGADVTAMITIDPATTGAWAEQQHLSYTTYTDLAGKPAVYELIASAVARANEDLPESTRIRRFVLLHKQLDPDDDEITRTRKVRRGVIGERYAEIIAALERGDTEVTVVNTITYQDGTVAERETPLRVYSMSEFTGEDVAGTTAAWGDLR